MSPKMLRARNLVSKTLVGLATSGLCGHAFAFELGTPLEGADPVRSPIINSVFDRQQTLAYTTDSRIEAFSGEIGEKKYGVIDSDCYKKNGGNAFLLSGNYRGAYGVRFLCYDGHPGVDLQANGDWVVAIEAGTITNVVSNRSNTPDPSCACLGNFVEVRHANGYRSRYGHLSGGSDVLVKQGAEVTKGQRLGKSGNSGVSYGPHLHLELWNSSGRKIDPFSNFRGLGDLSGGSYESMASAVSANGTVVVGQSSSTNGTRAFRWTQPVGMVDLGAVSSGMYESSAKAVSDDGLVVVGSSGTTSGLRAFRWTAATGMTEILDPVAIQESYATDVSADGDVVVGARFANRYEAFRWTSNGGFASLGSPGGLGSSVAQSVSSDGKVVVGQFDSSLGPQAFRWTAAGGMVGLGDLPGGDYNSGSAGTSSDGNIVVGYGSTASGTQAFRWTASSGVVGLGDLPGGISFSYASSVSGNGKIVVGQSSGQSGFEPFIWDQTNGMRLLRDVLNTQYSSKIIGWSLNWAFGISQDGKTVVGLGRNPNGRPEGWIVTLP